MPLSPPVGRQHLHTRRVTCQGFYREDGLWDIEGRITDEKTYEHANEWRGPLKPGDYVHDMSIRLTLDHRFTIVDVEAVTDSYLSEEQRDLFLSWVLTASFHDYPEGWFKVFEEAGYRGDWDWTILQT